MAGISTRTGGEDGRRRHDPTGEVDDLGGPGRAGPAAWSPPATADRLAGGAACDTPLPLRLARGLAGRTGYQQPQHDYPRRTRSPMVAAREQPPSPSTAAAGPRTRWPRPGRCR